MRGSSRCGWRKENKARRKEKRVLDSSRQPKRIPDSPKMSKTVPDGPRGSQAVPESPTESSRQSKKVPQRGCRIIQGANLCKVQAHTRCKTLAGFNLMYVWRTGYYIKDLGAAWA